MRSSLSSRRRPTMSSWLRQHSLLHARDWGMDDYEDRIEIFGLSVLAEVERCLNALNRIDVGMNKPIIMIHMEVLGVVHDLRGTKPEAAHVATRSTDLWAATPLQDHDEARSE